MATFVALSTTEHADLKLRPLEDLNDLRNQHLIPVYGIEIGAVVNKYPIVITRQDGDLSYSLSILCSLGENLSNSWIAPNGKWRGSYVPAYIRQKPFNMSLSEDDQRLVCIDTESAQLGNEGRPLLEGGKPTDLLNEIITFLDQLFDSDKVTQTVLDLLNDLELIVPLEIRIRTDGEDTSALSGIFRVDEEKLNQCDDEAWLKLKNAGAIPFIYGQILSLGNIQKMGALLQAESKDKDLIDNESLNFLFDKEDDNLNFSAL
jgi:hypothetical protein